MIWYEGPLWSESVRLFRVLIIRLRVTSMQNQDVHGPTANLVLMSVTQTL
jgi:hypothetical protein